jgi:hypothetical protein
VIGVESGAACLGETYLGVLLGGEENMNLALERVYLVVAYLRMDICSGLIDLYLCTVRCSVADVADELCHEYICAEMLPMLKRAMAEQDCAPDAAITIVEPMVRITAALRPLCWSGRLAILAPEWVDEWNAVWRPRRSLATVVICPSLAANVAIFHSIVGEIDNGFGRIDAVIRPCDFSVYDVGVRPGDVSTFVDTIDAGDYSGALVLGELTVRVLDINTAVIGSHRTFGGMAMRCVVPTAGLMVVLRCIAEYMDAR